MDWTVDFDNFGKNTENWFEPGSNVLLDFHGDPVTSELVVFSDGNHNMALKETLQCFGKKQPELDGFFYITTPPGPMIQLLTGQKLQLGNLILSLTPHVFIGPPHVLDRLVKSGYLKTHTPFVKNQGNVLLVRKGNPKNISSVNDLTQNHITVFLSNPDSEQASYHAYKETLANVSGNPSIIQAITTYHGRCIHHREAPEAVRNGSADVAVVFYHLARHYIRLFPNDFEMISLGGTPENPEPVQGNIIGKTHAGIVGEGGRFGKRFFDFLMSEETKTIYLSHGLIPLF